MDEGDDVTIECNTGISDRFMRVVSECRWIDFFMEINYGKSFAVKYIV